MITPDLGTAAGSLSLSAQNNGGTGNGGTIEVGYITNLTVSGQLLAGAGNGSGSNGNGGTVNLHDSSTLTVTGTIDASGEGSGSAQTVTVDSYATDISTAIITAKGGTNQGNGGTLNLSVQSLNSIKIPS